MRCRKQKTRVRESTAVAAGWLTGTEREDFAAALSPAAALLPVYFHLARPGSFRSCYCHDATIAAAAEAVIGGPAELAPQASYVARPRAHLHC